MYAMAYTLQFSKWLENILQEKGISQSELARRSGVTRAVINGILTGARGPGVDLCNGIARAQAERAQFEITFEEAQELLDVLPEWMLDDEPKIVNGLLTRLFRGIKIMGNGSVIPVLRN